MPSCCTWWMKLCYAREMSWSLTSANTSPAGCSSWRPGGSKRYGARSAAGRPTARMSAINCATSCSPRWNATSRTRSSRSGATGLPARPAGGKWSGWACASGRGVARHALDVLDGHIEKMRGDGGLAPGEHGPGPLDARLDGVRVPDGVLLYGAVDDLGLGGIGKRGYVADALLCRFTHLDR